MKGFIKNWNPFVWSFVENWALIFSRTTHRKSMWKCSQTLFSFHLISLHYQKRKECIFGKRLSKFSEITFSKSVFFFFGNIAVVFIYKFWSLNSSFFVKLIVNIKNLKQFGGTNYNQGSAVGFVLRNHHFFKKYIFIFNF